MQDLLYVLTDLPYWRILLRFIGNPRLILPWVQGTTTVILMNYETWFLNGDILEEELGPIVTHLTCNRNVFPSTY